VKSTQESIEAPDMNVHPGPIKLKESSYTTIKKNATKISFTSGDEKHRREASKT
jgi:hypothetical protein